jgi:hypothetical protein
MKDVVAKITRPLREHLARKRIAGEKLAENARLTQVTRDDMGKALDGDIDLRATVLDDQARVVMTLRTKVDVLASQRIRLENDAQSLDGPLLIAFGTAAREARQLVNRLQGETREQLSKALAPFFSLREQAEGAAAKISGSTAVFQNGNSVMAAIHYATTYDGERSLVRCAERLIAALENLAS